MARLLGADETFLATDPELMHKLNQSAGGQGIDIVVEVVGTQSSITTALKIVRRGGTVTLIGNLAPKVEIPLQSVVMRQLRLLGSCASAGEYRECIELVANGSIDVDPLVSTVAPLSVGPAWFDRLYNREPGDRKSVV